MSEFLAEAQVLVRPDTSKFRAELLTQLALATKGVTVPITVVPSKGTAAATTGFARLTEVQNEIRNNAFRTAGGMEELGKKTKQSTASLLGAATASSRLDAALLGLRTAVGSSAVIGLGALALAAIAAGKSIRAIIANTIEFEQAINTFRAVTGATAQEMNLVSEAAKRLGADITLPAVSAADAAVAMLELAKAGLTVQDSIVGAEGVLQLATAAQISNADAALITANALNSFGLAGDQAVRVADDLANAANAAQGSIADFGLALSQVAAVGRQVGLSLEDTTSLLTLLAKNGLRGSDAGTSLRVALLRLVAPTQKANALIGSLGINIRDLQGNVRADVFAQFAQATAELGPELRDAAAAAIFGADAIRAVAIAGREGAAGLRVAQFQIDQQGTAALVAAARTEGLGGAFQALGSGSETLSVSLGKLASPVITGLITGINDLITAANKGVIALERLGDVEIPFLDRKIEEPLLPGGKEIISFSALDTLKALGLIGSDTQNRLQGLREELQNLQQARVEAERGGLSGVANALTAQIKDLREQIRLIRVEAGEILPPVTDVQKAFAPLKTALDALQENRLKISARGADTSEIDAAILKIQRRIATLIFDSRATVDQAAREGLSGLATSLKASLAVLEIDPTGELANKALANTRRIVQKILTVAPESGAAGKKIGQTLVKAIQDAITVAAQAGNVGAAKALKALAERLAAGFEGDLATAFSNIEVPLLGDEIAKALAPSGVAVAKAEALGGDLIGALETRRQEVLDLIASRRATGGDLEGLYRELTSINSQIEGIQQGIVDEVEDAAQKRQTDFFDRLEAALRPIQRLQVRALGTESLKDDIQFRKRLIAIYRQQIVQIRKMLGDTKAARTAIAAIQTLILTEVNKLKQDKRNFAKELRDAVIEKRERAIEGVQLNVDFFNTTGNIKREIRARQNLIRLLKRAQNLTKKNTNEWREYRNRIAEEQAAIKELRGETKEKNNAFAELTFEFLQKQQGFAANLLGNLIPGGATGGLVGGGAGAAAPPSPGGGLGRESQIASGRDDGFSRGQGQTTNELLRKIYRSLENLNGRAGHPEARYQRVSSGGAMDTM